MTDARHGALTALVVEDDAANLALLDELLREDGFAPTCCARGQSALTALAQRRFDLLLIDLRLPDLSGLEICRAARAWYGAAPVIVIVTADDRPRRWVTALEHGADDCIGKPFDVDVLLAHVHAKLRQVERVDT
jgi:DNA-binding response OmpR family regulator